MPTIQKILKNTKTHILDAEIIIAKILGKPRSFVIAHPEHEIKPHQHEQITEHLKTRESGVPLAHITHEKEFFGFPFFVSKDTLIPRPETELLVEKALQLVHKNKLPFVDIGTGTGCIAITLLKKSIPVAALATDISRSALKVAKMNAIRHKVGNRLTLLHGHLSEPIFRWTKKHKIDKPLVIVANLPYVSKKEYSLLEPEVKHEPKLALIAKSKGLSLYKELLLELEYLENIVPIHSILFEISPMQSDKIKKLASSILPSRKIKIHKDLAGHDRVVEIK